MLILWVYTVFKLNYYFILCPPELCKFYFSIGHISKMEKLIIPLSFWLYNLLFVQIVVQSCFIWVYKGLRTDSAINFEHTFRPKDVNKTDNREIS